MIAYFDGNFTPLNELKRPCRHPRPHKANKEHIMRVHLKTVQCQVCGATFGQQGLLDDHRKRKNPCKPPKKPFTRVTDETRAKAAEMTDCDGTDEGWLYSIGHGHAICEPVLDALYEALQILATSKSPQHWSLSLIPVNAETKEIRRKLSDQEARELRSSDRAFLNFIRTRVGASDGNRQGLTGNVLEVLGPPGKYIRPLPPLRVDDIPRTPISPTIATPADSGYGGEMFSPRFSSMDLTGCPTSPSSCNGSEVRYVSNEIDIEEDTIESSLPFPILFGDDSEQLEVTFPKSENRPVAVLQDEPWFEQKYGSDQQLLSWQVGWM